MQNVLYGKFLGKALPIEQLRLALSDAWKDLGSFTIADMPNGFYFIRCCSPDMADLLVWEGPWTISGLVFQLFPWKPNFQPAFERLSSAALWVQLHHLPMELWEGEILEDLASKIGRLVKIDESTLEASKVKYARLCVDIDLTKPLKTGLWVGPADDQAFTVLIYERLPTFCYSCGCLGHASGSCKASSSNQQPLPPEKASSSSLGPEDSQMLLDEVGEAPCNDLDQPSSEMFPPQEKYGNWMVVQRRRGRGRGSSRLPASRPHLPPISQMNDTCPAAPSQSRHVSASFPSSSSRGKGGSLGLSLPNRSSSHTSIGGRENFSSLTSPPSLEKSRSDKAINGNHSASSLSGPDPPLLTEPLPSLPIFSKSLKGCASVLSMSDIPDSSLPPFTSPSPARASSLSPTPPPLAFSSMAPALSSSPALLMTSLPALAHRPPALSSAVMVDGQVSVSEDHSSFVNQIALALCPPPSDPGPSSSVVQQMVEDPDGMLDSDSSGDQEEGKTLKCFQIEAKKLARKEARKAKSLKPKGRLSDPY